MEHVKRAISVYDWITELNLRSADPNLQVEHFLLRFLIMLFRTLYHTTTLLLNLTYRHGLPKTVLELIINTGGHINLTLGMGVNLK